MFQSLGAQGLCWLWLLAQLCPRGLWGLRCRHCWNSGGGEPQTQPSSSSRHSPDWGNRAQLISLLKKTNKPQLSIFHNTQRETYTK